MRTQMSKTAFVIMAILAGCVGLAQAEVAVSVDPAGITGTYENEVSHGWRFYADAEMTITHLGVLDLEGDGLASEHQMRLWHLPTTGGFTALTPVVTVGPAGSAEVENNHVYVPLAEQVTLVPGEKYILGEWSPYGNTDRTLISADAVSIVSSSDWHWDAAGEYHYTKDTESTSGIVEPWGYTIPNHVGVNFKYTVPGSVAAIEIDIKPGSYPNSINLGSNGVVPVAILSTAALDATTIDAGKVFLAGANVAVRGKGNKLMAHEEDVNADGLTDLVVQVETENLDPGTFQDGEATVTVENDAGEVIYEGSDEITIVPLQ